METAEQRRDNGGIADAMMRFPWRIAFESDGPAIRALQWLRRHPMQFLKQGKR
jgi:hypothetical protein